MIDIDLTEAQEEIADWYMGSTAVEHWFEGEWSNKQKPVLENGRLKMPEDEEVLDDFEYRVNDIYPDMALQATEVSPAKYHGIERASNNLVEKVEAKHNQ